MNAEDLKKRTKEFALGILKLVAALPDTVQGKTIGGQLVRSGTSVASNYRAACRGRSRAEFIAKLGIVEEEADESAFWLELIIEGELLKESDVQPLLDEANELTYRSVSYHSVCSFETFESKQKPAVDNRQSEMKLNRQSAIGNRK